MVLGYHGDDDILRVQLLAGIPLALITVWLAVLVWRLRGGTGPNNAARAAVGVGVLQLLLTSVFFLALPVQLGLLVVLLVAVVRVPARGEARVAAIGVLLHGFGISASIAWWIACLVTDACFH